MAQEELIALCNTISTTLLGPCVVSTFLRSEAPHLLLSIGVFVMLSMCVVPSHRVVYYIMFLKVYVVDFFS